MARVNNFGKNFWIISRNFFQIIKLICTFEGNFSFYSFNTTKT